MLFSDAPGHSIAVFDFNQVFGLGSDATITAGGPNPVALLSRGLMVINGGIDASSPLVDGVRQTEGPGGFSGGGLNSRGGGPGGGDVGQRVNGVQGGSGGGGFGGPLEFNGLVAGGAGGSPNQTAAGGRGGFIYGNLLQQLQGGSGGGGTAAGGGGGGGGAIELGAASRIGISGVIQAIGGDGSSGGGGGSGGGILIHAPIVNLTGHLFATGGLGGEPGTIGSPTSPTGEVRVAAGGAGGGGRVDILTSTGELAEGSLEANVDVSGGPGARSGESTVGILVPELNPGPLASALTLLGGGVLTLAGRRCRK